MKTGHESEWPDVCGNCAFYDGTQTETHCCEVHLHTRLKTGGSCHSFAYDHSHYGDIDCNLNPFDPYIRCGNCGIVVHFTAMDRNIKSLQELNTIWNKRAKW